MENPSRSVRLGEYDDLVSAAIEKKRFRSRTELIQAALKAMFHDELDPSVNLLRDDVRERVEGLAKALGKDPNDLINFLLDRHLSTAMIDEE